MIFTITFVALVLGILLIFAYVIHTYFEYKKKTITIQSNAAGQKNKRDSHFSDWIDNVPFAKQQAIAVYNQQYDECIKQKMPKEQAEKVLKPLMDKIKLLESVEKYEPVVRVGAAIADKTTKLINK